MSVNVFSKIIFLFLCFFCSFAENSDHSNNNNDQDGGELTINKKKKKRKGLLDGIFDDEMDLTSVEGQRLMKATSKNVGALKLVSVLVLQITVGLLISNEFARWTRFVITGCLTVSPIKAIEIQWNSSIKRTFFFFFCTDSVSFRGIPLYYYYPEP